VLSESIRFVSTLCQQNRSVAGGCLALAMLDEERLRVGKTIEGRSDRFDETNIPPELAGPIELVESSVLRILIDPCRGSCRNWGN
jgi:hypothetical protein